MKHVKFFLLSLVFIVGFGSIGEHIRAADTGSSGSSGSSELKELLVRVYSEGKPVPGLTNEKFSLYEDKNPQIIEKVGITRRKIGDAPGIKDAGRCFVLQFEITEFGESVQKALSYILDRFLAPGDQLLVSANGQILFFSDLSPKEKKRQEIMQFLEAQSTQTRQRMMAELAATEKAIDLIRIRSSRETERNGQGAVHLHYYMKYIKFSLERYIDALKAYKNRYMSMDVDNYSYLLKPLESVNREKWLIRFCQLPIIPQLSMKNRTMLKNLISDLANSVLGDELYYSELFTKMLAEIDDLFNTAAEFPVQEMSRLYNRLGVVFHSLILVEGSEKISKDHKQKRLLDGIESSLEEIAQRSGGTAAALVPLASPDTDRQLPMETVLDTIRDTEDICYTLAYSPQNPQNPKTPGTPDKLLVEADNKNYRVYVEDSSAPVHVIQSPDKEQEPESPVLNCNEVTFKNKALSFTIAGIKLQKTEKGESGHITARIYIVDTRNNKILFDQSKILQPQKDSVHISLNFSWLPKGSYEVGVGANDLLTGKRATNSVTGTVL